VRKFIRYSKNLQVGDLIKNRFSGDVRIVVSERFTKAGHRELMLSGENYYVYAITIERNFLLLNK
tara:strand:- start:818 stop:1012 length:195 start_codon:yes stop_codon:yes gene_type:complete